MQCTNHTSPQALWLACKTSKASLQLCCCHSCMHSHTTNHELYVHVTSHTISGFVGRLLDEQGQPTRLSTEEALLLQSLQRLDAHILARGGRLAAGVAAAIPLGSSLSVYLQASGHMSTYHFNAYFRHSSMPPNHTQALCL